MPDILGAPGDMPESPTPSQDRGMRHQNPEMPHLATTSTDPADQEVVRVQNSVGQALVDFQLIDDQDPGMREYRASAFSQLFSALQQSGMDTGFVMEVTPEGAKRLQSNGLNVEVSPTPTGVERRIYLQHPRGTAPVHYRPFLEQRPGEVGAIGLGQSRPEAASAFSDLGVAVQPEEILGISVVKKGDRELPLAPEFAAGS